MQNDLANTHFVWLARFARSLGAVIFDPLGIAVADTFGYGLDFDYPNDLSDSEMLKLNYTSQEKAWVLRARAAESAVKFVREKVYDMEGERFKGLGREARGEIVEREKREVFEQLLGLTLVGFAPPRGANANSWSTVKGQENEKEKEKEKEKESNYKFSQAKPAGVEDQEQPQVLENSILPMAVRWTVATKKKSQGVRKMLGALRGLTRVGNEEVSELRSGACEAGRASIRNTVLTISLNFARRRATRRT